MVDTINLHTATEDNGVQKCAMSIITMVGKRVTLVDELRGYMSPNTHRHTHILVE